MTMKELMAQYPFDGVVTHIQVRPERKVPPNRVATVQAKAGSGLVGDRYHSPDGARQVTLIQGEHLDAVAAFLRLEKIDPALIRRNIVISGINLLSLKGRRFRIGNAVLEYSGECHPCSRMEENLGNGGYNAMRGHGGITARVITSGTISEGDAISVLE